MKKTIIEGQVHKISECIYPWLVDLINRYQDNYKGSDKMTRKYMMEKIKRFKND